MMKLNWLGYHLDPFEGYGRFATFMFREMVRMGVEITPATLFMWREYEKLPFWVQEHYDFLDWRNVTLAIMIGDAIPRLPGRTWGVTMYEADRVDPIWVDNINETCERLIVPCDHNQHVFEESGVAVPVHVAGLGICPLEFPLMSRNGQVKRPFTFVALGDRGSRKGIATTWGAFYKAFPPQDCPDVRLLVKVRAHGLPTYNSIQFTDGRVRFWRENVDSMADVYAAGDCFVFPSYGEGWGLPPREAAAMGIPVIVPDHTGLHHDIEQWATCIIRQHKIQRAFVPPDGAKWYVPDVEETATHMRWVYEHQEEARNKARTGAEWLHAHQTWSHAAQNLKTLIEEHL